MKSPSIASNSEVSDDQIETCVTLVVDATRKGAGTALRELARNGVLNKQNVERVRARGNEVAAAITRVVKETFAAIAENVRGIVKLISGGKTLELDGTDGKEMIANAQNTFLGGVDPDFTNYGCAVKSKPTKRARVSVHEMFKDGTFKEIFGGLDDDLNSLCLTQPQIINFVKRHEWWLRTDGYATFFLFKVGEALFVAFVSWGAGRLGVHVYRFSRDDVWLGDRRPRVVVPCLSGRQAQLAPVPSGT